MTAAETTPGSQRTKRTDEQRCPVCGSEAWRIAYGEIMPSERKDMPKTEFAGCCIEVGVREDPATGTQEMGMLEWACQNPQCRHRWW